MADDAHIVPGETLPVAVITSNAQKAGSPEEALALTPPPQVRGLTQLELSVALRQIDQIKSDAAMLLLCSHVERLESELIDLRTEKRDLIKEGKGLVTSYHDQKERCSVLEQRIVGLSQVKSIQTYASAIGGIMMGVGIPFIISGPVGWGWAGTAVGAALLISGFWPRQIKTTEK